MTRNPTRRKVEHRLTKAERARKETKEREQERGRECKLYGPSLSLDALPGTEAAEESTGVMVAEDAAEAEAAVEQAHKTIGWDLPAAQGRGEDTADGEGGGDHAE